MAEWQKATGTAWNPIDAMTGLSHRDVECPKCDHLVSARTSFSLPTIRLHGVSDDSAALMTTNGTGYLQHKFSFRCNTCGFEINKDKLAVNKFARDITGDNSPNHRGVNRNSAQIACVLVSLCSNVKLEMTVLILLVEGLYSVS